MYKNDSLIWDSNTNAFVHNSRNFKILANISYLNPQELGSNFSNSRIQHSAILDQTSGFGLIFYCFGTFSGFFIKITWNT